MIILIDAYNLIKYVQGPKDVNQVVIQSWIAQFCQYASLRNNQIILVFDAGPFLGQSVDRYQRVQVVFSGQQYSADQAIKNWLDENMGLDTLLVTSDRQIRDHASNLGVVSISSPEFYTRYTQVMHAQLDDRGSESGYRALVKIKQDKSEALDLELDVLMDVSTRHMVDHRKKSEYDQIRLRVSTTRSSCKKQRKIDEKLKKI